MEPPKLGGWLRACSPPFHMCMCNHRNEHDSCVCSQVYICPNQYLLLWLRGRARAECPGLGRWRFRSLCLRMEGGVTVTGVQLAVFIHWELGGRESGLGGPTFDLSVSSSESLCWRVFWKSATRASLDRSCLSRSPISLLLDCSCTQRDSQ